MWDPSQAQDDSAQSVFIKQTDLLSTMQSYFVILRNEGSQSVLKIKTPVTTGALTINLHAYFIILTISNDFLFYTIQNHKVKQLLTKNTYFYL